MALGFVSVCCLDMLLRDGHQRGWVVYSSPSLYSYRHSSRSLFVVVTTVIAKGKRNRGEKGFKCQTTSTTVGDFPRFLRPLSPQGRDPGFDAASCMLRPLTLVVSSLGVKSHELF